MPFDSNGIESITLMLEKSDRDDWWYIVGGQSSLQTLVKKYPAAADNISTVIV